jgi:hypothetical protein
MDSLGFECAYRKNHGRFGDFTSFENHAFIFVRRG